LTPVGPFQAQTSVQIGDDIGKPGHGPQLLDRPGIEGDVRADKPSSSEFNVSADNCIERAKQLHEKDGKLEGLRAGLKYRATAPAVRDCSLIDADDRGKRLGVDLELIRCPNSGFSNDRARFSR